jgi:uncharacterized protein YdcH (DUF465 family)
MMQHSDALKESLLSSNDEYRRLQARHHEYEERLKVLSDKAVLSDDEQLEETTLKKKKLHLRDRMEEITRQARAGAVTQ